MRVPSSTPGGTSTVSVRSFCTRPAPRQVLQGWRMILPVPRQREQVRSMVKKPWVRAHLAVAGAGGAGLGASGRARRPMPLQASQATCGGHVDLRRCGR